MGENKSVNTHVFISAAQYFLYRQIVIVWFHKVRRRGGLVVSALDF